MSGLSWDAGRKHHDHQKNQDALSNLQDFGFLAQKIDIVAYVFSQTWDGGGKMYNQTYY